jgi:hypothetical protein
MPSAKPSVETTASAETARIAERPKASHSIGATGRSISNDCPISPCSIWLAQCQYCSGKGWSKPSLCSSAACVSGVEYWPRISAAALDGRACVARNTNIDIATMMTMTVPSR